MTICEQLLVLQESAIVYTPGVDTAPYSDDAPRGNIHQKKIVANRRAMYRKDIRDRTTKPDNDKYVITNYPDIHGQRYGSDTATVGGIP